MYIFINKPFSSYLKYLMGEPYGIDPTFGVEQTPQGIAAVLRFYRVRYTNPYLETLKSLPPVKNELRDIAPKWTYAFDDLPRGSERFILPKIDSFNIQELDEKKINSFNDYFRKNKLPRRDI